MFRKLISTDNNLASLIARLTLGIVILPHGLQKLLGLFGGAGFTGTTGYLTSQGVPYAVAVLVILGESLGALGLITGFIGRFCALGIGLIMLGATLMVHNKVGFFMNWTGSLKGEGYEYHLLAMGLALIVLIKGSGALSIDRLFSRR